MKSPKERNYKQELLICYEKYTSCIVINKNRRNILKIFVEINNNNICIYLKFPAKNENYRPN